MNWYIIVIFSLGLTCQGCLIFPLLNCSCYQSNSSMGIYSHLYCRGKELVETSFQPVFGSNVEQLNQFRTISMDFSEGNEMKIHPNQFDAFSMLFSQTDSSIPIEISLRFTEFNRIQFSTNSITSKIFHDKHHQRRLSIYLIPKRKNFTQIELDNENITNNENEFDFSSNCFQGLKVSELTVYIHTIRDRFPSKYTFEQIFNQTTIGQLNIHGAIIRPQLNSSIFLGQIRSLKVHRHVDTIDCQTFPYYSNVYSYTIHSIEAHSMNLTSFLSSYFNLRGLEIIQPRFDLSIDQFLPKLDSLTLDIEYLTKKTLLFARHIHNLKIGSQLRRIDPGIFQYFSHRLHHLDLSQIDLTQMTSESRCALVEYLSKHFQDHLNIIYPRMSHSSECLCAKLFLEQLQYRKNVGHSSCATLCRFSDCRVISEYFSRNFSLIDQPMSPVEILEDPLDLDITNFLISQTTDQERNETQRRPLIIDTPTIATLENIQEYDDISLSSTTDLIQSITERSSESFSWLSFIIGVSVVLLLIIILSLIVLCVIKYRKDHDFKPVPVYV